MIDPKHSNIDFLDNYQFRQHFKDLSIEFGDENSKVIDVIKRSVVRGKSGNIIEILMDPPNIKSKELSYSLDFNNEELLEYYFRSAKKYRIADLESYYTENKPYSINAAKDTVITIYKLKFEDRGFSDETLIKLENMGHSLSFRQAIGEANCIQVEEGLIYGSADSRRNSSAVGY